MRPLPGSAIRGATPRSRAWNFGINRTVSRDPDTSTTSSGIPKLKYPRCRVGTRPLQVHCRTAVSATPPAYSSVAGRQRSADMPGLQQSTRCDVPSDVPGAAVCPGQGVWHDPLWRTQISELSECLSADAPPAQSAGPGFKSLTATSCWKESELTRKSPRQWLVGRSSGAVRDWRRRFWHTLSRDLGKVTQCLSYSSHFSGQYSQPSRSFLG